MTEEQTQNVAAEAASEWLEPSDVGIDYMMHDEAMQPAARLPINKAFALPAGYNVGILRKLAEAYKGKRIVVIDHEQAGIEIRRLSDNADVALFYAMIEADNIAEMIPDEDSHLSELRRIVDEFFKTSDGLLLRYDKAAALHRADGYIGYSYIQRRLASIAVFRKYKKGAKIAIKQAIEKLEGEGLLIKIEENEAFKKFNSKQSTYKVNRNDTRISSQI